MFMNFMQAIATAMRVNLHSSVLTWKLYSSPSKLGAAAALHETLQNLWTAILDEGKLSRDSGHAYLLCN